MAHTFITVSFVIACFAKTILAARLNKIDQNGTSTHAEVWGDCPREASKMEGRRVKVSKSETCSGVPLPVGGTGTVTRVSSFEPNKFAWGYLPRLHLLIEGTEFTCDNPNMGTFLCLTVTKDTKDWWIFLGGASQATEFMPWAWSFYSEADSKRLSEAHSQMTEGSEHADFQVHLGSAPYLVKKGRAAQVTQNRFTLPMNAGGLGYAVGEETVAGFSLDLWDEPARYKGLLPERVRGGQVAKYFYQIHQDSAKELAKLEHCLVSDTSDLPVAPPRRRVVLLVQTTSDPPPPTGSADLIKGYWLFLSGQDSQRLPVQQNLWLGYTFEDSQKLTEEYANMILDGKSLEMGRYVVQKGRVIIAQKGDVPAELTGGTQINVGDKTVAGYPIALWGAYVGNPEDIVRRYFYQVAAEHQRDLSDLEAYLAGDPEATMPAKNTRRRAVLFVQTP